MIPLLKTSCVSLLIFATGCLGLFAEAEKTADAKKKPPTGVLKVSAAGLSEERGGIVIYVYNSAENMVNDRLPFRQASARVRDRKAEVEFADMPHGDYAVFVYHDTNNNRKFDGGLGGLKKEKSGYSKNYSESGDRPPSKEGRKRPPTKKEREAAKEYSAFLDSKVTLRSEYMMVRVYLR